MSDELLKKAVSHSMKEHVPSFDVGDTVSVHVRIAEGDKERVQKFTGTVIARNGGGISETFTVRRILNNNGIERIFPLHSPSVADVEVLRKGKKRRAKLYYLRDRIGKATRLKDVERKVTGDEQRDMQSADEPPVPEPADQGQGDAPLPAGDEEPAAEEAAEEQEQS